MSIIGELLLPNLLAYLISLAAGERSAALAESREREINEALERNEALREALASTHSVRSDLRAACIELAQNRARLGVTPAEEPLWQLLSDEVFQEDLAEWLMAGGIEEGTAAKSRVLQTIEAALERGGAGPEQIASLRTGYFERVEKAVFAHPVLAHWRHQLSLDYLREQVAVLRQSAEEAAGVYSPAKKKAVIGRYCDKALVLWDIIDLSNLPAGDIHMATQKLLLRQLYMPLRVEVEPIQRREANDATLVRLEEQREVRRHREAGHLLVDESDQPGRRNVRCPVGERLAAFRQLVVLGDPGGGKTTMLRWMATAYLLRHKGDAAFKQVPDTQTLPAKPWIPVLIRCRDLGKDDLCRCFKDFLTQHLNKTELLPEEADVMRAVILDRLAKGEALLLVDGLDEITDPQVRMMFCQELEHTSARYPDAPIVVTSRIVGYRDMPYRMGSGFQHGVIAELRREDKDLFARRWVEVTEHELSPTAKSKRARDLLDALHSSDRIERLTGNPMLLTTLALVERKSGKIPNRRSDLYSDAVSVLLNFNPRHRAIDKREALPQLAYLAYEMCRLGVQRLNEDDILGLLERFREEYPNVRAVRVHEPQVFLQLLEAQSSILIKAGSIWQKDNFQEQPVWEFRHLTFQEYLAARALIDSYYSKRDKDKSLAEQVAPLAGQVVEVRPNRFRPKGEREVEVPESWREALRLLVADCRDDDVDGVLLAILIPAPGEESATTARPRTILASLCLSDEPNVSEEIAFQILDAFVAQVREGDVEGRGIGSLLAAGMELGKGAWAGFLKERLMKMYLRCKSGERNKFGSLWGKIEARWAPDEPDTFESWFTSLTTRVCGEDQIEKTSAALTIMSIAPIDSVWMTSKVIEALFALLSSNPPERLAGAWALGRLSQGVRLRRPVSKWHPDGAEVEILVKILQATDPDESFTFQWLLTSLGTSRDQRAVQPVIQCLEHFEWRVRRIAASASANLGDKRAVRPLIAKLDDLDFRVRMAIADALGRLGDKQAVGPLVAKLDDQDFNVRGSVAEALGELGDKQAVGPLIAKLDDQDSNVCGRVAEALGELGDKQAVGALIAKLDVEEIIVRGSVAQALGNLGDKQAVEPLIAKLDSQEPYVRGQIAEALGRLGDKKAVGPLIVMLDDEEGAVRLRVAKALGQLGDKAATGPLISKLDDQEANVRMSVAQALGQLDDKAAIGPLIAKLGDQDEKTGTNAAAALYVLGERKGLVALGRFLRSKNAEVRCNAVWAYSLTGDDMDRRLLSRDFDAVPPWLDPREPITESNIAGGAKALNISAEEVRARYEAMAVNLPLNLSWLPGTC